jgi:large subunit ribosomal protein L35
VSGLTLAALGAIYKPLKKGMKMPKLKTKSSLKLRFRVTATGKVKCSRAHHNHFMRKKSKRSNTDAVHPQYLDKGDSRLIEKLMPYGLK